MEMSQTYASTIYTVADVLSTYRNINSRLRGDVGLQADEFLAQLKVRSYSELFKAISLNILLTH